jgi:hypothetical protein
MAVAGWTAFAQSPAESEVPKRVLVLFGEGRQAPGNITLQQAFQAELQKLSTNRIDFLVPAGCY